MAAPHANGSHAHVPDAVRRRAAGPALPALQLARTPRTARRLAVGLGLFILALVPVLLVAPWTQTVHGTGRAIAFNPVQRPQFLVSPIEGRVQKWHVVEGDKVRAGQLLADLVDNDPQILQRLELQKLLTEERVALAESIVEDQRSRLQFVKAEQPQRLAAADAQVEAAEAGIFQARAEVERAKADLTRQEFNYRRVAELNKSRQGQIASVNELEEATRQRDVSARLLEVAQARVRFAERSFEAAKKTRAALAEQLGALVKTEELAVSARESDLKSVNQQFQTISTQVERQRNQTITAPTDGTVFRILANAEAGGQLVRPGERLAVLVPDIKPADPLKPGKVDALAGLAGGPAAGGVAALTAPDLPGITAELLIDGNDLPLVRKGDRVLLQFEGWAAVQFASYPEAAAGTFEGQVYLVDPTSDGQGRFRILVEPAKGEARPDGKVVLADGRAVDPWPDEAFLRQGVRAQGWVLIQEVRVGYELWRQLNGFPPAREVKDKDQARPFGPVGRPGGK